MSFLIKFTTSSRNYGVKSYAPCRKKVHERTIVSKNSKETILFRTLMNKSIWLTNHVSNSNACLANGPNNKKENGKFQIISKTIRQIPVRQSHFTKFMVTNTFNFLLIVFRINSSDMCQGFANTCITITP